MNAEAPRCSRCGGPKNRFSRLGLAAAGLAIIAGAVALPWMARWLVFPGIFVALVGAFFIMWATLGRGLWCRSCKTF